MTSLVKIFEGWEGYQTSLVRAVTPLTGEQLAWRPVIDRRSIGELVRHISLGRIGWFSRMGAPGIDRAVERATWEIDADGVRHVVETAVSADDARELIEWLELSWHCIQRVLDESTVADLEETYVHRWQGDDYLVTYQWTIWRIMSHDIHHGGQIAMMLAMQGIEAFELRALGGHIVRPALAARGSE